MNLHFYEIGEKLEGNALNIRNCMQAIEQGERAKEAIVENIQKQERLLKDAKMLLEEVER